MARIEPVGPTITAKGRDVANGAAKGAAAKRTGYDYSGSAKGGIWSNPNGVMVGYSPTEDSTVTPKKSTGDVPSLVSAYAKQRKTAGTKGYQ